MSIKQERVKALLDNRGKTYGEIATLFPDPTRDAELEINLGNKKGPIGLWLEWFITDTRPDNLSEADADGIEIKALAVRVTQDGYKPYENMRLSIINYNTIQTTPFAASSILKKSNMLIAINSKPTTRLGKDAVFYGFGKIDLNSVREQCELDYAHLQTVCREGRAHELHSSKAQTNQYLKTYSSGNGKNLKSYQAGGVICEAKGKAMYLFKDQWMELFQLQEVLSFA